jgi:hypothetical protein
MSSPRFIILLGSDQPIAATGGRLWRAVEGEPAYRRVLLADEAPGLLGFGSDVSVWAGQQIDSLGEAGDPASAAALLTVGQEPAPGHEGEFNAWMDDEHVPGLGAAPGTYTAHRYRSLRGEPEYFAVYHLRDLEVNKTPEWKRASGTATSAVMRPHARKHIRGLYIAVG